LATLPEDHRNKKATSVTSAIIPLAKGFDFMTEFIRINELDRFIQAKTWNFTANPNLRCLSSWVCLPMTAEGGRPEFSQVLLYSSLERLQ
jgi:hypothetical protein